MSGYSYKGIAFPFQIGATSFPAQAANDELLKQSLIQIIMCGQGERYMRPDFGCNAMSYVFEVDDEVLESRVRREVSSAISRSESRVIVQQIDIASNDDKSELTITINYVVIATGQEQQLEVTIG